MPVLHQNRGKKRMLVLQRDRCGGCSYCIEVCPEKFLKKSTGAVNERVAWTPESAVGKVCTMCDHCMWVCPDFSIYTVELPKEALPQAPAAAPAGAPRPAYPGMPTPYPGSPAVPGGVKR